MVVVLDAQLTDALRREGFARELINRIQHIRKDIDLDYAARIQVPLHTKSQEPRTAIEEHNTHIAGETLAIELNLVEASPGSTRLDLDGHVMGVTLEPRS